MYKYETALIGFAAKLSANQLKSLQKLNGFLSAYPDDFSINLYTTHSPQFLGLNPNKGLWNQSDADDRSRLFLSSDYLYKYSLVKTMDIIM